MKSPWGLFHSIMNRKKVQKFSTLWKKTFFEMIVPIDLLGPKEMIFSFAQKMSKNLVDPFKMISDIYQVQ